MSTQEIEVPKHFNPRFAANVEHLLQKEGSRLMPYVTVQDASGEGMELIKQFGATKARVNNDRQGDTPIMSTPRDSRWAYADNVEWGDLLERQDQVKMMIDPASPLTQGAVMAMGRSIDEDIIIPAIDGDAKTGKNGGTTTAYDTGNDIGIQVGGSSTDVGLNVSKVIAARELLVRNYAWNPQRDPAYIGITSYEETDLLEDSRYNNRDYGQPVLDNGKLKSFAGFEFVTLEEFRKASTTRYCPFWVKSGLVLARWAGMFSRTGEDPTKKFNKRIYLAQMYGASRTQEKKVGRILCKE